MARPVTGNLRKQPHCRRHRNIMPEYTPSMLKTKETRVSHRQSGPHKSTCIFVDEGCTSTGRAVPDAFSRTSGVGFCIAEDHLRETGALKGSICALTQQNQPQWPSAHHVHLITLPITASSTVRRNQHQHNVQKLAATTRVPRHCSSVTYQLMLVGQAGCLGIRLEDGPVFRAGGVLLPKE